MVGMYGSFRKVVLVIMPFAVRLAALAVLMARAFEFSMPAEF
jgi:hypothetical protein